MKKWIAVAILSLFVLTGSGCGYFLVAGAGATGGYILRNEGYKVRNPVQKSHVASKKHE